MKTLDGFNYQPGMTLYSMYDDVHGYKLCTFEKTWEQNGEVWFTSGSGKPGSFGDVSAYYATKAAAIREIIRRLTAYLADETASIQSQIAEWSAELLRA